MREIISYREREIRSKKVTKWEKEKQKWRNKGKINWEKERIEELN